MTSIKNICVFGGARDLVEEKYKQHAKEIGAELAKMNLRVVYGGSNTGVMHAAAEGAMSEGGNVLGIYPSVLQNIEELDVKITELIRVKSMYERKKLLVRESDVFIILPGGYGTLDELFEVLTLDTIGFLSRQILVYNQDGFWDDLQGIIDKTIRLGFAAEDSKHYISFFDTKESLISKIKEMVASA